MLTEKQIEANRRNAKQSTGPRTDEGKQRVSQNALKHGLFSKRTVIPGEDPDDFDSLLTEYERVFQPTNVAEDALVRQIADADWRLRRISTLEDTFLESEVEQRRAYRKSCNPNESPRTDNQMLGEIMRFHNKDLDHFVRYHAHFSRRHFQAIKQLEQLREMERRYIQLRFEEEGIEDRVPRPAATANESNWPGQSARQSQDRITPTTTTTSTPEPNGHGRESP